MLLHMLIWYSCIFACLWPFLSFNTAYGLPSGGCCWWGAVGGTTTVVSVCLECWIICWWCCFMMKSSGLCESAYADKVSVDGSVADIQVQMGCFLFTRVYPAMQSGVLVTCWRCDWLLNVDFR